MKIFNELALDIDELVTDDSNSTTYTGLTCNTFKQRFYGHRHSFNNRTSERSSTLSSHIWRLKDNNDNYDVKWNIVGRASEFNPVTKKCRLCIKEKYHIIFQPEGAALNERSELYSTCRHRKKILLANTYSGFRLFTLVPHLKLYCKHF